MAMRRSIAKLESEEPKSAGEHPGPGFLWFDNIGLTSVLPCTVRLGKQAIIIAL